MREPRAAGGRRSEVKEEADALSFLSAGGQELRRPPAALGAPKPQNPTTQLPAALGSPKPQSPTTQPPVALGAPKPHYRTTPPAALREAIVRQALRDLPSPARRLFLRRSLSLGGLSLLTGCGVVDEGSIERVLLRVSRFNDKVQAWLFDPDRLAPTYPDSMIERPFPFNAYYGRDEVPEVDGGDYRLQVGGLVADQRPWTLAGLRRLPYSEQVTRLICVEGWSAIGKWGGVPFSIFLKRIGADLTAKYVGFECLDGYRTSIDMPTALHAQTLLAYTWDGGALPPEYGFPLKLRMPTKLGYKNPKHIAAIYVANDYPGGYWEDQGYNWFGGS